MKILCLICLYPFLLYATAEEKKSGDSFRVRKAPTLPLTDKAQRKKNRSIYSTLGLNIHSTSPNFQATSSDASYSNNDNSDSVRQVGPSLSLGKEFFPLKRFSMTWHIWGARISGSDSPEEVNPSFDEKTSQTRIYSTGLDLNMNFDYKGMKVQPYIGAHYLSARTTQNFKYSVSGEQTLHNRELTYRSIAPEIGIRFIDYEVSLLSFFKISMPLQREFQSQKKGRIQVDGSDVSATYDNLGEFSAPMISFGFGWLY